MCSFYAFTVLFGNEIISNNHMAVDLDFHFRFWIRDDSWNLIRSIGVSTQIPATLEFVLLQTKQPK